MQVILHPWPPPVSNASHCNSMTSRKSSNASSNHKLWGWDLHWLFYNSRAENVQRSFLKNLISLAQKNACVTGGPPDRHSTLAIESPVEKWPAPKRPGSQELWGSPWKTSRIRLYHLWKNGVGTNMYEGSRGLASWRKIEWWGIKWISSLRSKSRTRLLLTEKTRT